MVLSSPFGPDQNNRRDKIPCEVLYGRIIHLHVMTAIRDDQDLKLILEEAGL